MQKSMLLHRNGKMRHIKGMGKIKDFFAFPGNGDLGNRNICLALGDSIEHLFEPVLLNVVIKVEMVGNFIPKKKTYS